MTFTGWLTIVLFAVILTALALPLGSYMAKVYTGQRVILTPLLAWPERVLYRVLQVNPKREQDWKAYAKSLIIFSLAGWLLLYLILRTQNAPWVPHALNPLDYHSAPWNVTFNTVSSFMTNTNWQYYSGETTMSYFSQMVGLTVQNWLSAGVGIVVAVALVRGIVGRTRQEPRQLLAGHGAHDSLRARAAVGVHRARARLPGGDRQPVELPDRSHDHRPDPDDRDGAGRLAGGDQDARHERRRLLQHQLGASVREPDPVHQLLRDAGRAGHPGGAGVHVRADDRQPPPGLRDLHDDDGDVPRRGVRRLRRRGARLARPARGRPAHGRDPRLGRRQHGRQGAALRDRRLGAVRRRHDRHLVRRGQQRDRVVHGHRRGGAVRQPVRQRGDLRRRRHGAVLDPAVRAAGGVHRRADGRAHAGVARQEARGARNQARGPCHPDHAAGRAVLHGAGDREQRRAQVDLRSGALQGGRQHARRASPRPSTPTSRRRTTTAPRSPATPASSSRTPATSAPTASPSPTCSAAST